MPIHELTTTTRVPRPRDEVFAFFSNPRNLRHLTPASAQLEILTPDPFDMTQGAVLDYRIRMLGFPLNWKSRISVWDPPNRFVDEQIRGPFRVWIHEHRFESDGDATVCIDHVQYDVPLPWLTQSLVRRRLDAIFRYRQARIAELFSK